MEKTAVARGTASTGTTGARGLKSPNKQDKKTQSCLILKPTCPWKGFNLATNRPTQEANS
jgi:hypothetical protein